MPEDRRIAREKRTIAAMLEIYCRRHHGAEEPLCAECRELWEYALNRLDGCAYGDQKPSCAKCPIHCYRRDMRERVRQVMRDAGPRMLWKHPILAIRHLLDDRRPIPPRPTRDRE